METVLATEPISRASERGAPLTDFDDIARAHGQAIYRFILASLRDQDAAETLTQDCLMRAYQAREKFRGDSSVRTWLMRIAVNLVRDHASSERLKFWRRASKAAQNIGAAAQRVADRARSPEAIAEAKEKVEAVWRAAACLSHKQRTVLLLRFVEDMEILEIAAATGMKEGTVKIHLFRALQKVRARIEGMK
jgi:RNA polymerase sigma-70 factor (ECF subfamily)